MSQQNPRTLATSAKFDSWIGSFPARPGSYYTQHRDASSNAQEAWTPYDGVPAAHIPAHGHRQRDPARIEKPWRNANSFGPDNMQPLRPSHHNNRDREHPRSAASSPPPKRSKVPTKHGEPRFEKSSFADSRRSDSRYADSVQGQSRPSRRDRVRAPRSDRRGDWRDPGGNTFIGVPAFKAGEWYDAEYLAETYPEIRPGDYPGAHKSLWHNQKSFLAESKSVNTRSSFITERGSKFRCNIVLTFSDGRIPKLDAIGDGASKVYFRTIKFKTTLIYANFIN